jgi:redox-sensitive bicupin YhaK (pirin superfamily)
MSQVESRSIEGIYRPPAHHWVGNGFHVLGYFSAIPQAMRRLDPFLMLDYHPAEVYSPTQTPRGVGVHPHRGFETVTLAWQGEVAHHDSTGAGGIIGPGDVQWMTAARGILHKEYHAAEWAAKGGPFQMAQLWVNLPRAHKMDPPGYQALTAGQMGRVGLPNDGGEVRVIAGQFQDAVGPARTHTPLGVFDIRLRAGGTVTFDLPPSWNAGLLVMEGAVTLGDGRAAQQHDFVVYGHTGSQLTLTATRDAQLLLLTGEPIQEPIAHYGPFVMNTEGELRQAVRDLQAGAFGHLAD